IEHSSNGMVPRTPAYVDALTRLYAAQKIYHSADFPDGHVTARSLAGHSSFVAANLGDLVAGKIESAALEANAAIFARYVQSLPAPHRARAETFRAKVAGKAVVHRLKHGEASTIHDPLHTLFLVPGTGPNRGLPGNYLHGMIVEHGPTAWSVHLHDSDDGAAISEVPSLAAAAARLQDLIESAPFHLTETESLGFRML
ncbi:MAG: hypothetical protein ACHQ5A_13180, partial [Opitutales bacterium]